MHATDQQILAVLLMAVLTYATRAGGLVLMQFTRPSRRMDSFLRHLSGSVMAAICGPAFIAGDVALRTALIVSVLVAIHTRNSLKAMACGVILAAAIRALAY